MGDLLGSPRVAPYFLGLTGTILTCHKSSQTVRPFLSPSGQVDRLFEHPIKDMDRQNYASEIFPHFLP